MVQPTGVIVLQPGLGHQYLGESCCVHPWRSCRRSATFSQNFPNTMIRLMLSQNTSGSSVSGTQALLGCNFSAYLVEDGFLGEYEP